MRFIVGLTGGIGCGKTTVADQFAAFGADVVDADAISHRLTGPGAVGSDAIIRSVSFGPDYFGPDGALDRAKLRQAVFRDADKRAALEALLHPLIGGEIDRAMEGWRNPYGVLVIPLLLETQRYRSQVDRVLVIDCPEELQIERVVTRSRLAREEVMRIMTTQMGRQARLSEADDIIDNSGALSAIAAQVAHLDRFYRQLAHRQRLLARATKC